MPQKHEATVNSSEHPTGSDFLSVMFMTFTTVFLAELGDKTQVATLLLTAQSGQPLVVFLGAAMALICSSLVAVVIGRWLSTIIAPTKFKYMAGVLMICIGLWIGIQALITLVNS